MIQPSASKASAAEHSGGTDTLDVVIIGGGPAGTAAAFRSKELGLRALVLDFDDILKRIRDYPKDKLILPDFGGGDKQAFPVGGDCIAALHFDPIDKDDMCEQWRALYETFDVPLRTGIELTGVERTGDTWEIRTWDHKNAVPAVFRTRHIVLALGRGVPRRFDISGNTDGVAYRLDDAVRYTGAPVLVVGGGTSAAEAVLAISHAKIAVDDNCSVYWSYRGTKMPRVSKALAERFFEAYIGNGNIRHFPESEPVSVVTAPDRSEVLSLRIDRKTPEGRPPETVHLEFAKTKCIACIGEDIPESLLLSLGIPMVPGGAPGKKIIAVTPLLETHQPNIYIIGDLLSQSYLETDDFKASPDTYRQVKHRGNIKSSLRDGVFVADVIKQRLEGRANVHVDIQDAEATSSRTSQVTSVLKVAADAVTELPLDAATDNTGESAVLVVITPAGIEAEEFSLKPEGTTALGRINADISFPQDTLLADAHASITIRDGAYYLRDDGSRSGTYLRVLPDRPVSVRDGDLLRAGRQILVLSNNVRGAQPLIEHYDAAGQQIGTYPLGDTTVFGRSGGRSDPDIILDNNDATLSRFHLSFVIEQDIIKVQDFGSRNGTYLKVDGERKLAHRDLIRIGGQQLEIRLREALPEKTGSAPVPVTAVVDAPAAETAPPPPPALPDAGPLAAGAATGPHVTFAGQDIGGAIDPAQTLLAWADENEVSIDYECWLGMCGCDVIRIISGEEHLNDVTEKEIKTLKRKGLEPGPCRLACMTRASGPVVVEVVT